MKSGQWSVVSGQSLEASRGCMSARRRGFSILEVILAIAILAGSMAVLGEIARTGTRAAEYAREMTQANLLCEDTMAQVLSGVLTPDSVDDSPLDTGDETDNNWLYSIDQEEGQAQGILVVTVSVRRSDSDPKHPISASITRWILDPNMDWTSLQQNNSGSSGTTSPTNAATPSTSN